MKQEKSELISQLAAEYVLGTLRGPARRRFARMIASDPAVAEQVDFWRVQLNELGRAIPAMEPPVEIRQELLRATAPLSMSQPSRGKPSHFRSRRRRRRSAALAASAATVVLAVVMSYMLGQRNPVAPAESPQTAGPSVEVAESVAPEQYPIVDWLPEPPIPREMIPVFVAELKIPSSQMRWLVSLSPDHRKLSVVAGDDFYQVGRSRLHLWGVTEDNVVHSLGPLPVQRDMTAVFNVPDGLRGRHNLRFVLSLESSESESGDHPKGQVLWESRALASI